MTKIDAADEKPCIRGCVWDSLDENEPPRPKPAKHGVLCNSCFYRLKNALELIPDLMANMRSLIEPNVGGSFIPSGAHSKPSASPAPLRIDPLDASDSLYAKLVSWTEALGGELHTPQPSVAVWINFREVQGSRPVTPETAHEIATQLVAWFLVRLDDITASSQAVAFHDDIAYGWEEARGVFQLAGAYGIDPRPLRAADKRECPICGHKEVFVKFPDAFDPDIAVLCGRCAWVAEPEKYGHYAKLFAL